MVVSRKTDDVKRISDQIVQLIQPSEEQVIAAREKRVDTYAEAWLWYRDWKITHKDKLKVIDEGAKWLRETYALADPEGTFFAHGTKHMVVIGPREMERTVNLVKAQRNWGMKFLRPLLKCTITALEKALGDKKDDAAWAIDQARTGSRDLAVVPKAT